jgi:hypothetical protein
MWSPGLNQLFDGSKKHSDASDRADALNALKDTTLPSAPSSNYAEKPLQQQPHIELSPSVRGATTLLPLIPCEKLKERWLGDSMERLSICDRIRILLGVRIASLFGVSAEMAAALTALGAGILIWNFKVAALPQVPSRPKELSMPQYCDSSNSIKSRGWGRR